ncbi:hypothetical protein YYE_04979 [Plasmodium vinckei vinckei]|uniref:Fam-a protein n=1 Tax=Plasmodium vinckei vinckei TaxID=54757 RepID=A0A081I916_PLAVN|nr:hypothetical protein YYE_04979 [Plasmodium vinckei vinckei]
MNKFYIQTVLFLLSIFVYVNNKALATEGVPEEDTTPELTDRCLTPEEIYEKNKDLLCTNSEEIKQAVEFMNEAVEKLEYYAINEKIYKLYRKKYDDRMDLYKIKNKGHAQVKKIYYSAYDLDKYNETINELWDPDRPNPFNTGDAKSIQKINNYST